VVTFRSIDPNDRVVCRVYQSERLPARPYCVNRVKD
jgi:hypothetical protein